MTIPSPFDSNLSLVRQPLTPLKVQAGKSRSDKWDPKPYDEEPSAQKALNCISIRDPIRCELLKKQGLTWNSRAVIKIDNAEKALLEDPVRLAEEYSDLISHHVSMRVALFFQQAVICYKTPFHYAIAGTEGQLFVAKMLKCQAGTTPAINIPYQAAHSSTIPSLMACPRVDYENAVRQNQAPKYFSFLGGSYVESLDNSTIGLPTFVNQVDTLIDGMSTEANGLRGDAIALINQVAQGILTPCDATRQFLADFAKQLQERPKRSTTMTDAKKKTIEIYQQTIAEMAAWAGVKGADNTTNTFFDDLLSVNFSAEKDVDIPVLREILYERKFEIIREAQFLETKIQDVLDSWFPSAVTPEQKHGVKQCLISITKGDSLLSESLQKLFAISRAAIECDHILYRELVERYQLSPYFYNSAVLGIRQLVRNFQVMEQSFQAMLLKDFRVKLRGKSQQELSNALQNVIERKVAKESAKPVPNIMKIQQLQKIPTSPATISRLENFRINSQNDDYATPEAQRRKVLSLKEARVISKALEVEPGHFFSSFFASASALKVD